MKYMGSKNRIAKHILPIILKDRKPEQYYVEPFVGGCNSIDKVTGNRIANDSNEYLIKLWEALLSGFIPPDYVDEKTHSDVKKNPEKYEKYFVAFVRFGCSFGADWNGGFARNIRKDSPDAHLNKTKKSYCRQSKNNMLKQVPKLEGVKFFNTSYQQLEIPENSLIYCDPPYEGTTKYKDEFNHSEFWEWCREMKKQGHTIFVSEYNAPEDFICVFESELRNSLNNRDSKHNKKPIEKLFTL